MARSTTAGSKARVKTTMPGPSISACASSACTARRPSAVATSSASGLAVEQHAALDAVRVRVVGGVGLDLDDGAELVQVAVVAGQPACRWGGRGLRSRRTPSSALGHVQVHRRVPSVNPCRSLKNPSAMVGVGHPYRIREIAMQAGLSEATVDRVLHGRGGVRASTVAEVHQAIEDLHRQRTQLRLAGRTFVVDLVVDAPTRFSTRRAGRAGGRAARASARPSSARGSTSRRPHRWPRSSPPSTGSRRAARRASCSRRRTTRGWSPPWSGWSAPGSRWSPS